MKSNDILFGFLTEQKADTVADLTKLEKVPEADEQDLVTAVMETTDMDNLTLMRKLNEKLAA